MEALDMKPVILVIGMLLLPAISCDAHGKPLGRSLLKKYFGDEKVVELVLAANKGDVGKIDSLVAQGVDVNFKGKEDITPLFAAFPSLNLQGFQRLLEHGADPNIPVTSGESVIWFVAMGGEKSNETLPMLKLCLQHGGNPNWVFHEKHPEANQQDIREGRPLIAAVVMYNDRAIDALKLLLDAGADINIKDGHGNTALWYAAEGHYDVLMFLLKAGATFEEKDSFIWSLERFPTIADGDEKEMAKQREWKKKVIEFLKEKGIDVHPKYPD
jgi:ankyrin repeat protein